MSSKIIIKTQEEIDKIRIACRLASEVLEMIEPYIKPGNTTGDIDRICHDYIVNEQKASPATLNYKGFPKSICTSINNVICHGIPSDDVRLKNGDIINIDVTVIKDGFYGDSSKMFCVGKVKPHARKLINVTQECLFEAIKILKEGAFLGDIGACIQNIAHRNHFSVVKEFCGHGVGKHFHEPPQVLHYGKAGTRDKLLSGMIFTIEPMINQGRWQSKILADQWTAITADGSLSAQFEHTVLIKKDGYEVLTLREEEKSLL